MAANVSDHLDWFRWTYDGVKFDLEGTGGKECANFIGPAQKTLETMLAVLFGLLEIFYAYPRLKLPDKLPGTNTVEPWGKRVFLVALCLTFGVELGYKFSTRQLIWILNPCHVSTMIQIYLLMAPPSKYVMAVFRLMMHSFHGAMIAVFLPVVNTRLLPFEVVIYWLQHALIIIIPLYLMYHGGVYTPEPLQDFSWAITSAGLLFIYCFLPVQLLAQASQVNLNNMLCPALSDPFYGWYYRLVAMGHSTIFILIHGKIYTLIAKLIIPAQRFEENGLHGNENDSNGHVKSS